MKSVVKHPPLATRRIFSRAGSDLVVQLEDYTSSKEIGLLDEGIDRYLSIGFEMAGFSDDARRL
jgi:hypothetical protein